MNRLASVAKKFAFPVIVLFVLTATACQLGLGAAVDSQAPVVEIAQPGANSIIRDKFVMSGTWSDDREIAGIKVELENTSTKEVLVSVDVPEAQLADNKWFLEINPFENGQNLPDGKYNATITVKDKVDHSTSAAVAFIIDNTAPLVILSRPATKKDAVSPEKYGWDFSLEGEAVDDNLISLVEVEVYDSNDELKTTVKLENVAKKIDRSVAVFGADDKAYEKIYGEIDKLEDAQQKNFYCKVFAYDEARQVPAVEGDKGNRTEVFYLESEVSKYISEYKSSGFYEILKGTYSSSERAAGSKYSVEQVKSVIENNKIQQASFSLDPRNNPKYTVSSRSNLSELNNDLTTDSAKLTNKNVVTINLIRGLDGYYIDLDTVGVSLIECDDKGKVIEGKDEIVLLEPFKEGDDRDARDALFSVSDGIYSLNVTISTKINTDLKIGKFYKFNISGKDENGIKIFNYAGTDYAFKLVSANATPNLTISKLARLADGKPEIESTSTTSTVLGNGEKLVIYGESSLEDLVPELRVYYGLSNNLTEPLATILKGDTDYGSKYEEEGVEKTVKDFKFIITIPDSEKNTDVKIRVIATNPEESEQQASKELDVSYDCTAPVFGSMTITPTVTENDVEYVNGTITIKGSVEDAMNTISEVYYYDGAETEANKKTIEKIAATGFKIDTTKFTDNAQTTVKVYAVDKAGNIGEKEIPLNVKQSTDAPVITFTTVDPEITTLAAIRSASAQNKTANIYQINGANNYIGGSITDDDGIKSVVIYKKAKGSSEWKSEVLLENGTTTAYNLKNVAAKVQGEYDVYIVVKDTAGEATGFNTTSMESKPFHIGVDEGSPNFMITSTQGLQAQNQDLVVIGTVSDGADVEICRYAYELAAEYVSGKRYFKKSGNAFVEQDSSEWTSLPSGEYYCRKQDTYFTDLIQIPTGTTSWTDTLPAAEVGTTGDILYYEATDIFGQTTGQSYYYTIDNQSPKFTIKKVNSDLNLSGLVSAGSRKNVFVKVSDEDPYLTIEGTAEDIEENDPTKSRGLDEFAYYTIIDADNALSEESLTNDAFNISSWKQTKKIENHSWKQTVDLKELNLEDGKKYILYVAVKDAAGNISKVTENPCSAVYIIPDLTFPVISNPVYKLGDDTLSASDKIQINSSNKDKEITLEVKVSDVSTGTPSGVKSVELLEKNVPYAFTKSITNDGDNYTVTIKASDLETGTHNLALRATDNVGNYNTKDFAWKEISVDITAPSNPLITGITPFVTDEDDKSVYNGKITIKVNASDETALDKVIWWVTKEDGTTKVIDETNIDCGGATGKNASVEIDTDAVLTQTNGTFKFFVKSLDKGGNESGIVSEEFKIDQTTDQPVITLNNAEVGITTLAGMKAAILNGTTANIFGSSTNNKLNFTVTDDDGIETVIITDSSKADPVTVYEYVSGPYQKTLKLTYTLPSAKELYDIKIDVEDCKGETASYKTNTTGTFKVAVDDAEPQITNFTTTIDSKLKDGVLYTNGNFKINFNVSDDYKLGSLVYSEEGGAAVPVTLTADASSQAIELPVSKQGTVGADAATKIKNVITVEDAFGRYKEKELTYVFDLKAPVFSNVTYTALSSGYMDASKTFTVKGEVTDDGTNQSGVNEIKFAVAKGHVETFPTEAANVFKDWTEVSGSASGWTAKIDAEEITEEGEYTLFVKATDLAGNEKVSAPIKFTADTTAPTSTISTPETYYNKSKAGTNVVIEGTITETYLDDSSFAVEVKKNGTVISDGFTTVVPAAANGNKWSVTIPVAAAGANDGSYEVKASFKDYIHKAVSTSVAKTMIDTKAPVFSNVDYSLVNGNVLDTRSAFSVTGKTTEEGDNPSGVNTIKFAVAKGHVESFPATETVDNTAKTWTSVSGVSSAWTAKLDVGEISDGGDYTLFVKAADYAGNETDYSPIEFTVDTKAPDISAPVYKLGDTTLAASDKIQINTSNKDKDISLSVKIVDVSEGSLAGIEKVELIENNVSYAFTKSISNDDENYTVTIKAEDLTTGIHNLVLRATDKVGNYKDFEWKEIGVDVTDPSEPLITGITPFVTDASDNTVYNGNITIKLSASDETALDKITWWVTKADGTTKVIDNTEIDCAGVTSKNTTVVINTDTKLTNTNGTFKFFVKSQDKGGNNSTTVSETLVIDQATDQPVITLNNAEVGITTLAGMKAAVLAGTTDNIFGSSTNNKLNFTVTDDDGIALVKVNDETVYTYSSGLFQKTLKLTYTLPSEKKLYDIKIDVEDCKGETASYKTNTTGTFKVAVDDSKPEIEIIKTSIDGNLKNNVYYAKDDFTITLDVQDDYKLDSLSYVENSDAVKTVTVTKDNTKQRKIVTVSKRGTAEAADAQKVKNIFTVKDAFGRFSEAELTYVFDLKAPVISNINHTELLNTYYMDAGKTFTVTGKVTDDGTNQSGVNEIKFAVAKGHVSSFPATETTANTFKSWTEVSGSASGWTAKLDAGEITEEGEYTLFVKATDLAGNETLSDPIKFTADNAAPTSTISTPDAYYKKAASDAVRNVVISGTLTETNYDSWTVVIKKNGTAITTGYSKTAPASNGAWSVTIPFKNDGTNDGKYDVAVSFKDKVNKTSSTYTASTTIDTTPLTFSNVTSNLINTNYMDATKTFSVTGKVNNPGSGASGVNEIKFAVAKGHVSSFPATETTANTFKSWTDVSGTAASWTAKLDANEITVEGNYTLFVKATDLAGNEAVYGSPIKFTADNAAPISTISTPATYYNKSKAGTNVVIEGTITETYLKSFAVEVTKNETPISTGFTTVAPTSTNGNKWSVSIPVKADASNDGTYTVKATFTDNVNKSGSTTVATTTIDTTPLTFASVASNLINTSYMDATKTFSVTGVVNNPGSGASGVNEIKFAVAKGHVETFPTVAANVFKDWTEVSGSAAGWTAKLDANEITIEGNYTLFVKATDLAGNVTVSDPIKFTADNAAPTSTISTPDAYYKKASSDAVRNVVISGTLTETNFDSWTVIVKKNGTEITTGYSKSAPASNGAWSVTIPFKNDGTNDGKYDVAVSFKDKVNKTSSTYTASTTIDTVAPSFGANVYSSTFENWTNVNKITVTPGITATDLESKSYIVSSTEISDLSTVTEGEWNNISADSKSVSFEDGTSYLYLRAVDKAGNITYKSGYSIQVDTVPQEITINSPDATLLVNGQANIAFKGTVSENGTSGINKIEIFKGGYAGTLIATTVAADQSASVAALTYNSTTKIVTGNILSSTIDTSSSSFGLYVLITDNAGNTGKNLVTVGVDTVVPTVEWTEPQSGDTVYRTVSFKGRSSDMNPVESTVLKYLKTKGATAADDVWVEVALKSGATTNAWIFDVNTFDADARKTETAKENRYTLADIYDTDPTTPGIQGQFKVVSVDKAGNIGESSVITLTVNQDADRPVIEFTDLDGVNNLVMNTSTVHFTVSDNDAVNTVSVTNGAAVLSAGSYTFTPESSFGEAADISLSFTIKDKAGRTYTTAAANEYDRPYVKFTQGSQSDNTAAVVYKYDVTKPVIESIAIGTGATGADATTMAKGASAIPLSTTETVVGGTKKEYVVFKVTAKDTNKVKEAKGTITKSATEKVNVTFTLDSTTENAESQVFYSAPVDLAGFATSTLSIDFTAKDNSNLESLTVQCNSTENIIYVDNAGPVLAMEEPLSSTENASSPLAIKGSYSDAKSGLTVIRALVLDDTYYSAENKVNLTAADAVLNAGTDSALLTESTNTSFIFSTSTLPMPKTLATKYTKVPHDAQNIYTVPVRFYMEDTLGNISYETKEFLFNPYGNRPKSAVTYPAGTAEQRASLNGAIRITGSAAQGSSTGAAPTKVYLQFDMDKDGEFTAADKTILAGLSAYGYSIKTSTNLTGSIDYSAIGGDSDFWGIEANGTTSWYYTVNQSLELQNDNTKDGSDGKKFNFAVRVVALAGTTFGSWSDAQFVQIDTNLPVINRDTPYITPSSTSKTKRVYQQDMYLKGTQYLHMTVSDAETTVAAGGSGIKKVMIYRAQTKEGLIKNDTFANGGAEIKTVEFAAGESGTSGTGDSTIYWKSKTWGTNEAYGYELDIPLTDLTTDSMYVKVVAYKANDNNTYEVYNMNFDNVAPTIDFTTLNSVKTADSDMKMLNSNGRFTVGGEVEDTGAGFDKAAFYYYRGAVDSDNALKYDRRVYDPMPNITTATAGDREVLVQEKESETLNTGISSQEADGTAVTDSREVCETTQVMFGATKIVEVSADGSTVTLSADDDKHIRAGGLVYIGGTYLVIDSKTGTSLTLVTPSAVTGSNVTAFFPYMQVVDNTGAEKTDDTGLVVSSGDDGDGMPESIVKSSTKWTWDATFDSLSIPDGPGYLVVFVWDKAGNVSSEKYAVSVQNNAPRLTKLQLGTKLSGSAWKDSDFQTYDVLSKVGEQNSYAMNTADYLGKQFRIRGDFAVVAEMVGGNLPTNGDTIKAVFNKESGTAEKVHQKGTGFNLMAPLTEISTAVNDGALKTALTAENSNTYMYVISKSAIDDEKHTLESTYISSTEKWTNRPMSFTFWDTTSDTVQGIDSCFMFLRVKDLAVNYVDKSSPVVKIDPFYWNSREDSSVPLGADGMPLGHIDLETDISKANPAVSGRVYIRGSVEDDTLVKELYMITPGEKEDFKVASYNGEKWTAADLTGQTHVKSVTVNDVQAPDAQNGHKAEYCIEVDMSKYGVAAGKEVRVYAKDSSTSGNPSTKTEAEQTTSAKKTSLYTMDFVPYIKGVRGANRSRLGRYPVQAGQNIVIEGMNFAEGAKYKVNFYKSAEAPKSTGRSATAASGLVVTTGDDASWAGSISTTGEITIKTPKFSTYFEVAVTKAGSTTDYVETSNNNNSNDRYNIEEGNWKNGDLKAGANYWNDDRYLSVWNVNTSLVKNINPLGGLIKKVNVDGVHRRVDDGNGAKSSHANNQLKNRLLATWSSPNDLQLYDYPIGMGATDAGRTVGKNQYTFNAGPSCFDTTIINGIPFYIYNDNFHGHDSDTDWGNGMSYGRQGTKYALSNYTSNTQYPTSIEYQGYNTKSQPNVDEQMNQFTSPHITGWNSGNNYYIYMTYYDSYAQCLKYAFYKEIIEKDAGTDITTGDTMNVGTETGSDKGRMVPVISPNKCVNGTTITRHSTDGISVVRGFDTTSTTAPNPSIVAGEYNDIVLDESGTSHVPVIVYYNKSSKCLEIARAPKQFTTFADAPKTFSVDGNVSVPEGYTANPWVITESIKPEDVTGDFGRYVSAQVDKQGNLHITAQEVNTGKLYYLFMTKNKENNNKYDLTYSCVVDATSDVGNWTDIQLNVNTVASDVKWYKYEPVISYLNKGKIGTTNAVKVAFLENDTWEAMTDPAKYECRDAITSVAPTVSEGTSKINSKLAVGFNADYFAVDFLRDEQ